jgi:hypothetical protein
MMMLKTESMSTEIQTCLSAIKECQKACMESMAYCMSKGGKYIDVRVMSIMRDCAEMCMMCANMMKGSSEFVGRTCMLCYQICEKCAEACENWSDDKKIMECIIACRKCAEYCKIIATVSAN